MQTVLKNLEHLHLCLFFLWRRYYELGCRLTRVRFKADSKGQGADYLGAGRLMMA